jgi:hypothetical protein
MVFGTAAFSEAVNGRPFTRANIVLNAATSEKTSGARYRRDDSDGKSRIPAKGSQRESEILPHAVESVNGRHGLAFSFHSLLFLEVITRARRCG